MSAKKYYNLGDSSQILKIGENILKCDLIQSPNKLESNIDDEFNEWEMNQAWGNIHHSNHNQHKPILKPDKIESSENMFLLSPPLFSFGKISDNSKGLIDSLGLKLNSTTKVPRYNIAQCDMISELKLEIPLNFRNILKEILDPFYKITTKNVTYQLEDYIFTGGHIEERLKRIAIISIPEDKYELKYFGVNFSTERLTPKLNVKELITNQLSFNYEECQNPMLEYPILNYEYRTVDHDFTKNIIQNLSISQETNISYPSLNDFNKLYFQKFKLYISSYEENDPSYMISNPSIVLFDEKMFDSNFNINQATTRFIQDVNPLISPLQDINLLNSIQKFEQTYPNEKLCFSPANFEISKANLDRLLRQKRELSVELQADQALYQFSNNDDINIPTDIIDVIDVIVPDSQSLSTPLPKKTHTWTSDSISKSEQSESKSSIIHEPSEIKIYKDTHKYIVDQNMLQNTQFVSLLGSKFNIEFIVRYLSTSISKFGPDLIYDEDNCLLLTSDIELHQIPIEANVTEQLFGLERLKKIIYSNLPRFNNIWIILQLSINSQKLIGSSSNRKLNQLLEEKLNIENTSRKRVRLVYSDSMESSAHLIRLIGETISNQYSHLTNFSEVPAWNSKSQWLDRGWLKTEETTHERFLCSLLWLTPFTAQLVLTILDLNQLLSLNQKELQIKLGKWISSDILNGLYRALHYPMN